MVPSNLARLRHDNTLVVAVGNEDRAAAQVSLSVDYRENVPVPRAKLPLLFSKSVCAFCLRPSTCELHQLVGVAAVTAVVEERPNNSSSLSTACGVRLESKTCSSECATTTDTTTVSTPRLTAITISYQVPCCCWSCRCCCCGCGCRCWC